MKFPANKILLIATRQIGDVLLVTPLLHSLRQAYPTAIIDVLVYENKGGMLIGNPDYNQLISVAEHPNIKQYFSLLKRIFRRYDLAISTLAGDRPLIYALLAAPQRIAIVPKKRWQDQWKRLISQAWCELDNENTHTVIQNLQLADLLEINKHYSIILPNSPNTKEKLDQILPFSWQTQAFAVLHLLPMWQYKRWHGFAEMSHYLTQNGLQVILTGGNDPQELAYISAIKEKMSETTISVAGKLNFGEITTLLKQAKIFIGPDTAVTHLAAATGTPTVAVYGPTNPLKWSPWPHDYAKDQTPFIARGHQKVDNVMIIQGIGDCVPCHQEGCDRHKQSHSLCLERLDSTTVITKIEHWLLDKKHDWHSI